MAELNDWNVAAANNNDAPPDGFPENMNYSEVNNSARESMAVLKRFFADINGSLAAGGVADAYTLTLNASYTAYFDGFIFACTIPAANTTADPTINVNAIGARTIKDYRGNAIGAGDLATGGLYLFADDGTNLRVVANLGVIENLKDNATKEIAILNDASIQLGDGSAAESYSINLKTTTDGNLVISGGPASNSGANLALFGNGNASLRFDAAEFLRWLESSGYLDLYGGSGASKTARFRVRNSNTHVEVIGELGVSDALGNRRLRLDADNINATINYANNGPLNIQINSTNALVFDASRNADFSGNVTAANLPVTVYKSADETVNNSTTLQNDDDLVISLDANSYYEVEALILASPISAAPGIKWRFLEADGTWQAVAMYGTGDSTAVEIVTENGNIKASGISAGGSFKLWTKMTVLTGVSGGNFQFQWAQNFADASDLDVLAGSWMKATKVG